MRRLSWVAIGMAAGLLLAQAAWAQADKTAPPAAPRGGEGAGTTIIGDRESPIGLYLTPWKNEHAERSLDRPPQLLQEELAPVDPKVFHRQIEYYDKILQYRQLEMGETK